MPSSISRVRFLLLVLPLSATVSFFAATAHWAYIKPQDAESILLWAIGWLISVAIQLLSIPALLWLRPRWARAEPQVFRLGLLAPLVFALGLISSVPFLVGIESP